jgi:hypothetical protein
VLQSRQGRTKNFNPDKAGHGRKKQKFSAGHGTPYSISPYKEDKAELYSGT